MPPFRPPPPTIPVIEPAAALVEAPGGQGAGTPSAVTHGPACSLNPAPSATRPGKGGGRAATSFRVRP